MGKNNGMAVASMVLGIVSVCIGICAPIALILGLVALSQIKKTGQPGKGMAITGVILGAIFTFLMIIGIIMQFAMGIAIMGG